MAKFIAIPTADGTSLTNARLVDGTTFSGLTNGTAYSVYRLSDTAASATPSATATVPGTFGTSDWSAATGTGAGGIAFTLTTLPSNGGSAITALQYSLDGGTTWVAFSGTVAGSYTVTAAASATSYTVSVRAVNAIGTGAAAAAKSVTSGTVSSVSAFPVTYLFGADNAGLTDTNGGNALTGTVGSLAEGYLATQAAQNGLVMPFNEPTGAYTQVYVARPTSLTANAIVGGNLTGTATDGGMSPFFSSAGKVSISSRGFTTSLTAQIVDLSNFFFMAASFDKTGSLGAIAAIGIGGALVSGTGAKTSNTGNVSGGDSRALTIGNKHYSSFSSQPAVHVAYAKVYNTALTLAEITALYAEVKTQLAARSITVA